MKRFSVTTLTIITLYVPLLVHGEDYVPLVGIPGVDPTADFSGYINSLYALSISIAALLAVIKIIIAGVKYMLTDIVTSKGEAKKDVQGALIGLLIVLSAVLILTVINPDLVNVNLTLNKPNEAAYTGTAATPATLTAPITTAAIPGTDTKIQYIVSTDPVQKQLFLESCKENLDRTTDPQVKRLTTAAGSRCLKYPPTENSYAMGTNCSVTDCKAICNSDTGTGVGKYLADPDPLNKAVGYCVKPEYPTAVGGGGSTVPTAPSGGGDGTYSLAVFKGMTGSGTIVSNPAGINCGPTCAVWKPSGIVPGIASFPAGTQVTITVIPSPGFKFSAWGAGCFMDGFTGTVCDSQPSFGSCTIDLDKSKCISINFEPE